MREWEDDNDEDIMVNPLKKVENIEYKLDFILQSKERYPQNLMSKLHFSL